MSLCTANMVKYFSVDWLAQNHDDSIKEHCADMDTTLTCKPHIPCMVQPNPPPFGKSYLETKTKIVKGFEYLGPAESFGPQDSALCSPLDSSNCTSLISDVSEYLSGYESDSVSPESLSVGEGNEVRKDGGPQRRVRTKFSPEQIKKLERIFIKQKYLDSGEREKTAEKLNLTETQVRTWFQNRRMKLKREVQDYLTPPVPPVIFQPLPPVQYHSMAGHLPHYTGHPFYPLPVPHLLPHQHMPHHHYPHRTMMHHPQFY
ncbi:ventral homeobox [Archocentrus centrarchus]|uniref:ventral homeobox n=1 Tax=Archocentrus centrarchus TaxID=63155 RepID=UPI0011E9E5EF|nr:homeobox protein vent1-like [Archocentrus centrarchus]